jgi:hypothetical protein
LNDNNSMLDRIMKKEEHNSSIIPFLTTPIVPQFVYNSGFNEKTWMISQQKGVSEDEASQEEEIEEKEELNDKKVKN